MQVSGIYLRIEGALVSLLWALCVYYNGTIKVLGAVGM